MLASMNINEQKALLVSKLITIISTGLKVTLVRDSVVQLGLYGNDVTTSPKSLILLFSTDAVLLSLLESLYHHHLSISPKWSTYGSCMCMY